MSQPTPNDPTSPLYSPDQLGQVVALIRDPPHPQSIGSFRILEILGQGGMGVVYRAEQRTPIQRIVALKLIKVGMDTAEVISRFDTERQALALMNHPNVAKVLEAGTSETGRPYFVMEYVPGEPITQFCDRQNYTTRQRLVLFMQACDAVQHAHQKAIIHRDIKPSNILVMLQDGKPLVKVIDFGVAKAISQPLTEKTLFTQTGQLVGTPEYMSPEQAEMSAVDVDTRSDIYSLGVVLYELLSGALPFDPKTLRSAGFAEIQRIIREVEPPRPSTRLPGLGDGATDVARRRKTHVADLARLLRNELEWIPLKAMRKERGERYVTADQFAEDIRNYLQQRPLLAGPESTAYRLRKFLRRHKGPVAAIAAVLVVLMLGVIGTGIGLRQAVSARNAEAVQRARADQEAQNAFGEAAKQAAVSQFLNDMLESANPWSLSSAEASKGRQITVLEVLNDAAKKLDAGSLRAQPQIELEVRATLGHTYRMLGEYTLAEPHLRKALLLSQQLHGAQHADVEASLGNLAALLCDQGKPADAEPLLRDALAIALKLKGPQDPIVALGLNNLADALRAQGKLDEAESLFRETLELRRQILGNEHADVVVSLNNLALVLKAQGRLEEAEPLYREALAMSQTLNGNEHPDVAMCLNNLAQLLWAQGELAEAESLHREALAMNRKLLGDEHRATLTSLSNLAMLLQDEGKLGEAESMLRAALEGCRRKLGENHPDTLLLLKRIAATAPAR